MNKNEWLVMEAAILYHRVNRLYRIDPKNRNDPESNRLHRLHVKSWERYMRRLFFVSTSFKVWHHEPLKTMLSEWQREDKAERIERMVKS